MSKGGSTSSQVEIPAWLENAAIENINRAKDVQSHGYVPYYGPEVAAFTPMQQQAMQATGSAASAYGLAPQDFDAMAGMPLAEEFAGGQMGYSSMPLYNEALAAFREDRPAQASAIDSMFINPYTGEYAPSDYSPTEDQIANAGYTERATQANLDTANETIADQGGIIESYEQANSDLRIGDQFTGSDGGIYTVGYGAGQVDPSLANALNYGQSEYGTVENFMHTLLGSGGSYGIPVIDLNPPEQDMQDIIINNNILEKEDIYGGPSAADIGAAVGDQYNFGGIEDVLNNILEKEDIYGGPSADDIGAAVGDQYNFGDITQGLTDVKDAVGGIDIPSYEYGGPSAADIASVLGDEYSFGDFATTQGVIDAVGGIPSYTYGGPSVNDIVSAIEEDLTLEATTYPYSGGDGISYISPEEHEVAMDTDTEGWGEPAQSDADIAQLISEMIVDARPHDMAYDVNKDGVISMSDARDVLRNGYNPQEEAIVNNILEKEDAYSSALPDVNNIQGGTMTEAEALANMPAGLINTGLAGSVVSGLTGQPLIGNTSDVPVEDYSSTANFADIGASIAEMIVGKTPKDMAFDINNDGVLNITDTIEYMRKARENGHHLSTNTQSTDGLLDQVVTPQPEFSLFENTAANELYGKSWNALTNEQKVAAGLHDAVKNGTANQAELSQYWNIVDPSQAPVVRTSTNSGGGRATGGGSSSGTVGSGTGSVITDSSGNPIRFGR
ncbi:MAG: hypothetical protein GY918_09335 [Gammaproteobacteria bacterium]|nr:hypothetical protein [Gammaproteobacteria bacterium]